MNSEPRVRADMYFTFVLRLGPFENENGEVDCLNINGGFDLYI